MSRRLNASLGFIFVTILVDVIGIGIIIPVLPSLIEKLNGEGLSEASRVGGWLMFAYAIMQFVCAPFLGALSDKYGRRPILLMALFGLGCDYVFHAFAPTLTWLFVGRVLAGITGASFTVATAYIADISTPEKKAQNFGLVGAAFGLGFIVGPVIGGLAAKWGGVQAPFLTAAALSFLNLIYGYFILPESLPPEKRQKSLRWQKANPIASLIELRHFPMLIGFLVPFFLIYIAGYAVQSTWTFYTMYRFGWDEAMVGYSLALVGIVVALVQGLLIGKVVKRFGQRTTIMLGMALWTLGLLLFAFASKSWMMFAFIVPYCLGGVAGPTLQGLMSNMVPDTMQGRLQGTLTSVMSLTAIIGPPIMTYAFYLFSGTDAIAGFPGAPFMLGAILMTLAAILTAAQLKRNFSEIATSRQG